MEELADWYATVPVGSGDRCRSPSSAVVGLCGPRERVEALAPLARRAGGRRSTRPRELAIAAAVAPGRLEDWDWLKWLPHADAGAGGPLALRLAVGAGRARGRCSRKSARLVAARQRGRRRAPTAAPRARGRPHVLLLLDEERRARAGARRARCWPSGGEHGVSVLWLGRERRDLPGECAGDRRARARTRRGWPCTDARAGPRRRRRLRRRSRRRARARSSPSRSRRVRDTGAARGGRGPGPHRAARPARAPRSVDAGVGRGALGGRRRRARRRRRRGGRRAVLASTCARDGPHGARRRARRAPGKSELLQTLIASLARLAPARPAHVPARRLQGRRRVQGLRRACRTRSGSSPTSTGTSTQRALASLNAELQRRERILRDAGAKDLADMERARRRRPRRRASLIVIDEFATLAKEVPEFVEGVVDVAQRGRSLGVHLLLATQRPGRRRQREHPRQHEPAGRAARERGGRESTDVIGVPDAARIPRGRPGRAYARTGHGELAELQTAYVGGGRPDGDRARRSSSRPFRFGSARAESPARRRTTPRPTSRALVDACAAAARAAGDRAAAVAVAAAARRRCSRSTRSRSRRRDVESPCVGLARRAAAASGSARSTLDLEQEGSVLVYGTSGARQDGVPAHARARARGAVVAGRAPRLRARLRDPRAGAARGAPAHAARSSAARTRSAPSGSSRCSARRSSAASCCSRRRGVFTLSDYRRLPAARAVAAHPRAARRLRGLRRRLRAREPRRARRRAAAARRPRAARSACTSRSRPTAAARCRTRWPGIVPAKVVLRMADEDEFAALGVPPKAVRGAQLPPGRGFLPGGHRAPGRLARRPRRERRRRARRSGYANGEPVQAIEPLADARRAAPRCRARPRRGRP